MIKFEHTGLRYGVGPEILSDINFTLEPGSFHFLTGPSGAGKTSLLSLMYLGQKPTRGLITMFGQNTGTLDRTQMAALRRRIGVVFQNFRLLNHMSAFDNVALPLRIAGKSEKEIRSNVNELMEWVGLGEHKHALPSTMSGGQQQRIAIARAVITRPRLLLADEPTGNLDDEIGFRLMTLFDQLNRMGTTVVIATHNLKIMEKFGHPRLILDQGSLVVEEKKNWLRSKLEGVF
ncbi:MAG: cell division ATP-binding protein FtsE [Rhodospirillales bacterium]|nr:cell division ATP-binding protein FtsE [Alphaproteobacteria bacterium]USO03151.1 MAG: cell division ATP-binding protein FtsE [Rhodospirillales bacterium]